MKNKTFTNSNKISRNEKQDKNQNKTTFQNYMQIAIDEARKSSNKNNEIPVGCVIVNNDNGKIVAKSCNKTIKNSNPTQHAEVICINQALKKLKTDRLANCSIYITLEPCPMCAGALALAKIGKIYIGCESKKTGAIINNIKLFSQNFCNHKPEIYHPIMEKECKKLITSFFDKLK